MAKKIISILLVFSVNILLLAYAVIPHHHHDGLPHFTFSSESHHHHSDDPCCCDHDETCADSCLFDREMDVFFKSRNHTNCGSDCESHSFLSGHLLVAVLFSFCSDIPAIREAIPLRVPPYLICFNTDPVISATGLRAPPLS